MLQAPEGVIVGGWSYVIAAFSATAIVLVAYAWSLFRRLHRSQPTESNDE